MILGGHLRDVLGQDKKCMILIYKNVDMIFNLVREKKNVEFFLSSGLIFFFFLITCRVGGFGPHTSWYTSYVIIRYLTM